MEKQGLIQEIYTRISEEKANSSASEQLLDKFEKVNKQLQQHLGTEQQQELEVLEDILNDMSEQENEEFFTEGFLLGIKLMIEVFYNRTE